jgi:hypothetical protein
MVIHMKSKGMRDLSQCGGGRREGRVDNPRRGGHGSKIIKQDIKNAIR